MDPTLNVHLEATGETLTNIVEYSISCSYPEPVDTFTFTAKTEAAAQLSWRQLHPVTLILLGRPQIIGRIDGSEVGGHGTAVTFHGRDYIADAVECCIDPAVKLARGMALFDALSMALGPVGVSTVVADSDILLRDIRTGVSLGGGKSGDQFRGAKLEDYRAQAGEGIYEFCSRLVVCHGGSIQPSSSRDSIVVSEPDYDQPVAYRLARSVSHGGGATNNIMGARAVRDMGSFPTYALISGKSTRPAEKTGGISGKTAALGGDAATVATSLSAVAEPWAGLGVDASDLIHPGRVLPADGAKQGSTLYRLRCLRDDEAKNQIQIEATLTRTMAEYMRHSLRYEATVAGHIDRESGALWSPDTLVEVADDACGISETMWIESVTHSYSPSNGPTTTIRAIPPGSYVIGG